MPNVFTEFKKLLPADQTIICTVVAEHGDGTTSVSTLDGNALRVQGVNGRSAGSKVFVQAGRIIGDAPSLAAYSVTV